MFYFHDMLRNYCLENAISILNKNAYGYNDFKNVRDTCKGVSSFTKISDARF